MIKIERKMCFRQFFVVELNRKVIILVQVHVAFFFIVNITELGSDSHF
jgi:hypothetical protein